MTLTALLDRIESHETSARLNLGSDLQTVVEAALADSLVVELHRQMKNPKVAALVVAQALKLTRQAIDVRFENPYDIALLVYVLVLHVDKSQLAGALAGRVCQMPNLWWASKYSTQVLENSDRQNVAKTVSNTSETNHEAVDRLFVFDAGGVLSEHPSWNFTSFDTIIDGRNISFGLRSWVAESSDTHDAEPTAVA